jgi:D-sedoheptulose 7-phosphate isomerase
MIVIGLTGEGGGKMAAVCHVCIQAPSDVTPTVQECHAAAGHTICLLVEQILCGGEAERNR